MAIRILVVDDHPVTILSLRMLFQESKDIELVGEASRGSEALENVAALRPDIVLLDSHLPDMPGKEVAEAIIRLGLCTVEIIPVYSWIM